MRAFAITVLMGFKHYFRDRSSIFWGMAFPVILMGLIGLAFGRSDTLSFTVALLDRGGPVAAGLRSGLIQVPVFKVVPVADEAAAVDALRRGEYTLVVVPPDDPQQPVRAYFDQARMQDSQTALVILERFIAEANLQLAGVAPRVRLQPTGVAGERALRFFDFLLPGILAMTVMQTGLSGVTWVVTDYRERLILKRVLATPVHPAAFLGGLIGRYTVTSLVQLAVIVVIAIVAFHAAIVGSLVALTGLAIFGTLVFVGMGFAISTVSRTAEAANLLGSAISFPMMFLSGTFWPRDFMPAFMQPLIDVLPLTPLVETMRAVSARGDALTAHLPALAYLGLWGLGAFAVAARRFRWE